MVLFKHTPIYLLQYENRSWRMKQSIYGCLVQDHTGRQEKTEHLSSGLPPSVSCRRTALFCLMLHGSAWEEPGYCWAERQSKENPVATAADCRGRIPRLQLPVMFHAATLRWDRRREKMYRSKVLHQPGQNSHIILHPSFLMWTQRYRNKNVCISIF